MHRCEPEYAENKENMDGYGEAVTSCIETDIGEFWVGNGEYGSRVNYCPFCGEKAPVQIGVHNDRMTGGFEPPSVVGCYTRG